MKSPRILTIFQFAYLFTICKTCTSVPESILESVLECVLESEYQTLELLDFRPIFAYNSSNISCFSGKYSVCLLIFVPHEPWHSRGQRFDPAYLRFAVRNRTLSVRLYHRVPHQKSPETLRFQDFFCVCLFYLKRGTGLLPPKFSLHLTCVYACRSISILHLQHLPSCNVWFPWGDGAAHRQMRASADNSRR